jgi:hypothetical protein
VVVEPTSRDGVVELVVARVLGLTGGGAGTGRRVRVLVDGHPSTEPGGWADALVEPLRAAGHEAFRVSAGTFLRAASLRLERGHEDPDALYESWLDAAALEREVLRPFGPGGTGRFTPSLRDPVTDRPTREPARVAPSGSVLLLDGALLLGQGLPADLTVHLAVRPATLRRRTPDDERWTLPAYDRYEREVQPSEEADVVVHVDDARHPAVLDRTTGRR